MRVYLFACLALAGCAATPSAVLPVGDGFMVYKQGGVMEHSGGQLKAELFQVAAAHCAKTGQQLVPVASTAQDATTIQYASAEVQFRCR